MRQSSIDLSVYARPGPVRSAAPLPVVIEPQVVQTTSHVATRGSQPDALSSDMIADLYADNLRLMRDLQRARRFIWIWMLVSALIGSVMMYLAGMLAIELRASRPGVAPPLTLSEVAITQWRRRDEIF